MKRDDRLYDLIRILRDGRLHTAAELAATLGVSTRTIWRDMGTMAASGLPVEGERGLGYILRAPVVLPPMILTQEELDVLVAGLRQVAREDGPAGRAARSLLAKIGTVLPQAGMPPGTDGEDA
ncbi:MAG: helix-turn-helix transcriptional regulator [Gemmobacter sp.]